MSDARVAGPQQRKANQSELMRALNKSSKGDKVNFCPFGCGEEQLDDLGHCDHLIGIALPDGRTMEPMVKDESGRRRTLGSQTAPIPPGAKLVRITTCYRVYHDRIEKTKKAN